MSADPPMHVEQCIFMDGQHYGPPGCAHTRQEDELGPVQPTGWTIQQGHRPPPDDDQR